MSCDSKLELTPLLIAEFSVLMEAFSFLQGETFIAVAVSGGPDSLALTLLLHQWAHQHKKQLIALTVDHALRPESTQEALQVQSWMQRHNIPHKILTWQGHKPTSRIQETARQMRYFLLHEACREQRITTLFLAHQAYDQVETFLMRLSRGSGLRGLCSMRTVTPLDTLTLVRPLLSIPPERLKATLESFSQPYLQDPSNDNEAFERIRWRHAWQGITSQGLSLQAILKTIDRLQDSQGLVETYLADLTSRTMMLSPYGYITLDWQQIQTLPLEVVHILISEILQLFSIKGWGPNQSSLKRLCHGLLRTNRRIFTLGGTVIQKKGTNLFFFRETRALPHPLTLSEGPHKIWWDFRFFIDINVPSGETWTIRPLTSYDLKTLKLFPKPMSPWILLSLPSIWCQDTLLFAPGSDMNKLNGSATLCWKKFILAKD